jgi:hypothetical protein
MHALLSTFFRGFSCACVLFVLGTSGGCGTTSGEQTQAAGEDQEQVSTIPWNKPQKWEQKSLGTGAGMGY